MLEEAWESKPEEARCWWKMELNELSGVEDTALMGE